MQLRCDADHRYWLGLPDGRERQVPGVTEVLKPYSAFAAMDPRALEPYAARGKAVHRLCELHDTAMLQASQLDDLGRAYIAQWQRFLADSRFDAALIEYQAYSRTYDFAGRLDRYGKRPGKRGAILHAVVDIKTGIPDRTAGPQTSAYAQLVRENLSEPVDERFCVYLTSDNYKIVPLSDVLDFKRFCAALTIHNWS